MITKTHSIVIDDPSGHPPLEVTLSENSGKESSVILEQGGALIVLTNNDVKELVEFLIRENRYIFPPKIPSVL